MNVLISKLKEKKHKLHDLKPLLFNFLIIVHCPTYKDNFRSLKKSVCVWGGVDIDQASLFSSKGSLMTPTHWFYLRVALEIFPTNLNEQICAAFLFLKVGI